MAELSLVKTPEEWWPSGLKLLELEYENSKLLVQQDGLMFEKWKTDIDLLIKDEKLHRESRSCEKLSQTSREDKRLLQDQIQSLEKELKGSKETLCQTKESLENVKEKSKIEKERLQERLTIEAEERHVKEQEKFKKEKDGLNEEIEKLKNMKEKLELEMREMEKNLKQEADEKSKQQEKEANGKIENLNKELQTWKERHAKAVQEVDDVQRELANKTIVSKTKATQTQKKMANKAVMVETECATIGIQAEILTDCDKEGEIVPKKQSKAIRKSVHDSCKDLESLEQATDGERGQQSDKQLKKNRHDSKAETNGGLKKQTQKRTRNSRKNVQSKQKKTSDNEDGTGNDEEHNGHVRGDVSTGPQENVSSETHDDVPTEMNVEVATDTEKDTPTGAKSNSRTGAQENLPTGVTENQSTGHQAPDKESSNQTVKRVRKRKCTKEPCKIDESNAKKTKSSCKNKGSVEDKEVEEKDSRDAPGDNGQQKKPSVRDKTETSSNSDKQRKTSERKKKENILKDKNGGTKPVTANGMSKTKYPSTQPSMGDRTRQSSIAEMSSILNGTKRQRTLYNTKDTSLMVSILPVQESFMNSTMSRGNKPNGTMPPSLSAFMRSFIAPKLKKKSS
ncbi:titin homolog [Actinia tenebrosa]|uniref:Titin homolog n=1 Tax=Actinia tenebrosa TaxID=6105 RepID=A0A6P8I7E2_ACTTE|nr:titin homolog [Actinia tenebrosa]